MRASRGRLCLPIVLLLATAASAQQKQLTIDDIYDPQAKIAFGGHPAGGFVWIDGSHYAWPRTTDPDVPTAPVDWMRVDAATGAAGALFDAAKMQAALAQQPGVGSDEAGRIAHSRTLVFDGRFTEALATIAGDLYVYTFAADRAARLTYAPGEELLASFSPDGRLVAFVRDNNLFVVDVATGRENALTTDGTGLVLNGRLDWVYEEEIYGRGKNRAYWWSPDSSRIAFLQIDDRPVPDFVTVDDIPYDPDVEHWRYPRAGDPNPIAKLGVVRVAGGGPRWIDTSRYSASDHLIVSVEWTPDSARIAYAVQNRTQTWLDLNVADAQSGDGHAILRETSRTWVDSNDLDPPHWLKDGSFLWLSERSGWKHLYHYGADGRLIKQVTDGRWELRDLHGIDESSGWIYFAGTERSPIGVDVYRIRLDGTGMERLSKDEGTHAAVFSPTFAYYIDRWSDASTPPQVRLHASDGREIRVVDANKVPALAAYRLSKPEFLHVTTRDGFVMEAEMIKPPDFDPSRRYPVYQFTYGGPHAPMVRNAWGGESYMYHQLLAQHGIIVWICDNRTASGKGIESTWPLYRHFGDLELRDIEDGLGWLKQQPYVDGSRIGIHGWSYGGFMTSYALTHSTSFVMGIAGGTVADWRDYDSVYTERYMGLPQENPDGYRNSSPRWAAQKLHGDLLLIHGVIDDNVHVQNTLQFAYELQKAQKPLRLMLYPKSRHGVTDPLLVKQMRTMMLDFTLRHLQPSE
ncbi:MAG: S9 family peptidase [Betaproteobacteria bacterium]